MKLRLTAIAAFGILLGAASCVKINEELGDNFIPTNQIWQVFPCPEKTLEDITLERSDSLSGYSTTRFTFGSVMDSRFVSNKGTSFTLVPLVDSLDFGTDTRVRQFHFTALRDTVSVVNDREVKILQNIYVRPLRKPLDSTILYTGSFSKREVLEEFVSTDKTITRGIPVYDGGDSLSFDFNEEYAWDVINGIKEWQAMGAEERDSLGCYLEKVPGIYIETENQTVQGGRINMFGLALKTSDGYIDANYAELKISAKYDGVLKDTLFVFYFGPSELLKEGVSSYPTQYAFNASTNTSVEADFLEKWNAGDKTHIYVEGGSGYKPVVKAAEIKRLAGELIRAQADKIDTNRIVINKATINLPYDVGTDFDLLDKYPDILSPTVKLVSDNDKYVSYAGLTDSSIESENQGNINLSLCKYCPDISHHVQEIVKLKRGVGEDVDPNETEEQFNKRLKKYDIWFLIMHKETVETSTSGSAYDDYYNNLLYNSYYNNMMYDPYGYGYGYGGYGYGGYGYGGYGYDGYGYNNYYNYLMMAQYASASNSTSTTSSIELDRDRFYNAILSGPNSTDRKPTLKITFSAPRKEE